MNIIIPMAGQGSRFKIGGYERPKPLIKVNDVPMIKCAIDSLGIEGRYIFIIRKYHDKSNTKELEELLKSIKPDSIIIKLDKLTSGCAETCLKAKSLVDNDDQLIITNCDQVMEWNSDGFIEFIKKDLDGVIVTYDTDDPKHSFVSLDDSGFAKELREKDPISNLGLVGIHYWKRGCDFVSSAENNISGGLKEKNEFYIAPTYNDLINRGFKIKNYHLESKAFNPIGTPEDLDVYIGKKNEFKKEKIKTIICDIDGTLLKHIHKYSSLPSHIPELTPGVVKKFDRWDSLGYKIILMTGRKESAREQTVLHLQDLGIPYDQLIMSAGNGQRFLINDKLKDVDFDRAISINVLTDSGFEDIDWKKYGL